MNVWDRLDGARPVNRAAKAGTTATRVLPGAVEKPSPLHRIAELERAALLMQQEVDLAWALYGAMADHYCEAIREVCRLRQKQMEPR